MQLRRCARLDPWFPGPRALMSWRHVASSDLLLLPPLSWFFCLLVLWFCFSGELELIKRAQNKSQSISEDSHFAKYILWQ